MKLPSSTTSISVGPYPLQKQVLFNPHSFNLN
jgi:hypothetical protein